VLRRFVILFCCCFCCLGCHSSKPQGIPTEPVAGIVTLDGSPADNVTVKFNPKAGQGESAVGTTDAQGNFQLTSLSGVPQAGALEGEYAVTFSKMTTLQPVNPNDLLPNASSPKKPASEGPKQLLPKVYQDFKKTPVSATVKKGKNTFEFELYSNVK